MLVKIKKNVKTFLAILLVGYLSITVVAYGMQTKLVYHPDANYVKAEDSGIKNFKTIEFENGESQYVSPDRKRRKHATNDISMQVK